MDKEEISKLVEYAQIVETVYENYSGNGVNLPDGWQPIEYDALKGVAKNDEKKEIALAFRGLMLDKDPRDALILSNMVFRGYKDDSPNIRGGKGGYYDTYGADIERGQAKLDELKLNYPDYSVKLLGHSRGAAQSMYLGRRNKGTKVYAFAPPQTQSETIPKDYSPDDINVYYTNEDIIPLHTRRQGKLIDNSIAIDTFNKNTRNKVKSAADKFSMIFGNDINDAFYNTITKPLVVDFTQAIINDQMKDPQDFSNFQTGENHYLIPSNKDISKLERQTIHGFEGHDIRHFTKPNIIPKKPINQQKTLVDYDNSIRKFDNFTPNLINDTQLYNFEDYVKYLKSIKKYTTKEKARQLFDILDIDNDGYLR